MSGLKCPVCHSTDNNGVTCNVCGAMLFFEGDDHSGKDKDTEKKKVQSVDDIIREILEASNVKTSPFEKIEYDDDASKGADLTDGTVLDDIDTDKTFADLAREIGYSHCDEEQPAVSEDIATDEALSGTTADTEEMVTDVTSAVSDETIVISDVSDALSVGEEANSDVSDTVSDETKVFSDSFAGIIAEGSDEAIDENSDACEIVPEEADDEPDELSDDDVSEAVEDATVEMPEDGEASSEEDDSDSDKISLVEKISRKVSEKIRSEANTEDEGDEEAFPAPQWAHSDKTVIKEKRCDDKKEEDLSGGFHIMDADTSFNLPLNICRFLLIITMLITVVCMFLPSTRIGGFSSGQSVQIFAVISVVPFIVGIILSVREKHYIRKFIYSFLVSVVFAAVYFVFTLSIEGSSSKDIVYPVLCAFMAFISLIGIFVDKSSKIKKANTWFDAFVYILLFVDIIVILMVAIFMLLVPEMMGTSDISIYLYELCAVMLAGALSALLILKRKAVGADLLLISTTLFILVNIISYNKMMSAIGFDYTVNIPYMSYMGFVISGVNIFSMLFAAGMFFWMRHLEKITPKKRKKAK